MYTRNRTSKLDTASFSPSRLSRALNAALVAGLLGGAGALAHAAPDKPWRQGQILVKPKAGLPQEEFDRILKRKDTQARTKRRLGNRSLHVVEVSPQSEEALVQALSRDPNIEFAELDMAVPPSATTPNDTRYGSQWHLPKIQAPASWDSSKADNIVIAVLDTGVDAAHPDLSGKLLPGWNAVDGGYDTSDMHGHGTAVAGTAAAQTDNANGVAGVAWNAAILPVRITNRSDGYAYWSDVARALTWAADQGADVANISYGVTNSATVANAAQYMRSKGGLVVVAGGNDGADAGYANNPHMITVSATDSADAKASWSNYGAFIDVAAPGVSIQTTSRGGGYGNWSGTSFASPVTAGAVALIMAANPALSADQVEAVLKDSADKIAGDLHPYYGYGRINVANGVSMAMSSINVAVDNEAPSANIFSPGSGSTVSGLVQVDINATDNVGVTEVALYANGQLVGTDGTAPYQFSWDSKSVADGSVTLGATAVDAAGNEGASGNVSVTVKNQASGDLVAPTVTIGKPADGSKVKGTVSVSVSAQDDVKVANVRLYIDGKLVSSTSRVSLSYNWNTRTAKAGAHTIAAVATDGSGKSTTRSIKVYR
ncbi:MAG: S8 family serine peptidase [Gammaproteobacteria bacterium]|jgi:thermitase|nr:S8 family serine peptidase [Gammaproteobacteria bacterium]